MTRLQVMDLTAACQCFPELVEPQVPRDNILNILETILGGETHLVTVEGPPGTGKTTLLAQFVKAHPRQALSLFARPVSRWTYDPELLRFDLCNQLQWLLKGEELSAPETASDAFLRMRLSELQRRARRERQKYFIVVDGLEDIPQEEHQVRDLILSLLPLGLSGFRFILSASGEKPLSSVLSGVQSKSYPLAGFVFEETARYFADLNIGPEELREVYRVCRGSPGNLASVRRIIRSGTGVSQFLDEAPSKVPDLFEIEWRAVDQSNTSLMTLLGLLSHDRGHHTMGWLALVLGLSDDEVGRLVSGLGFLSIDPVTKDVSFASETLRKYSAVRLQTLKRVVSDMVIDYLLRNPQSESAFDSLPRYLEEAGRHEELLEYLSPENFAKMLECTSSLSVVQEKADIGIGAAWRLRRDGDLLRFSIQRASLVELDRAQVWRPEIEARIALGDHEGALALAQSTVTLVDRLHLLAVVAKAQHQSELGIEPELVEQIRLLYDQVSHSIGRNRAVEIASALIYSAPDLAIHLVEKGANATGEDENSLDLAFAALSIAALVDEGQKMLSAGPAEMINQHIKDPAIRKFSSEVALLLGKYSASEVLAEVGKVEGIGNRLYLLSEWATTNRRRADAADVVEYSLLLAIRTTAYTPNAAVLRKLASPLPFFKDDVRVRQLIAQFDGQRTAVEQIGPTEEYVRLQLVLARAECKYNREGARNRFVDIYLYVANLNDISIRASLLGRLVAGLLDSDPTMSMDSEEGIHGLALEDLQACVRGLLASTAEQTHAIRDIVRVLAPNKMDMAVDLSMSLNVEYRRDEALLVAIRYASRVSPDAFDVGSIQSALARIEAPAVRDEAILEIVNSLSSATDCVAVASEKVVHFVGAMRKMLSAHRRCRAYCLAYDLLSRASNPDYGSQMYALLGNLNTSWGSLEEGWRGISVGFEIAKLMSKCAPEVARIYLSQAEHMRAGVTFDDREMTTAYIAALKLTVRALGGLLLGGHEGPDDVERLARLITFLPSSGQQAVVWADLALQYSTNGRTDDCKRIVSEHLRPLLGDL